MINIKNRNNVRQSKNNMTSGITADATEPYLADTKENEDESPVRPSILLNSDTKSRNLNLIKLNQESQDQLQVVDSMNSSPRERDNIMR